MPPIRNASPKTMTLHALTAKPLILVLIGLALMAPAAADPLDVSLRGLAPRAQSRVMGGDQAYVDDWPWQVFLIVPRLNRKVGFCGGTLIDKHWVLTAAHCVVDPQTDPARAVTVVEKLTYFDWTDTRKPIFKRSFEAKHIYPHQQYDAATHLNDIALIELAGDASSQPIEPLLAPDAGLEAPAVLATATGWGHLRPTEGPAGGPQVDPATKQPLSSDQIHADHLMKVTIPLVAVDQCRSQNGPNVSVQANLCAGSASGGKDTCQGDSGGPLMANRGDDDYVQIGIVSWGFGCGEANHPGVYTRVSSYADWIRTTMKGEPPVKTVDKPPVSDPAYDNAAGVSIAMLDVSNERQTAITDGRVGVGTSIAIKVAARKPGYLVILDKTADNKLVQIYPNERSLRSPTGGSPETNRLDPGRPLIVPDPRNPYNGFLYRIDKPSGKGTIAVFLSETPMRSVASAPGGPKSFDSPEEAQAFLDKLKSELAGNITPNGSTKPKPRYSAAYLPYTIK